MRWRKGMPNTLPTTVAFLAAGAWALPPVHPQLHSNDCCMQHVMETHCLVRLSLTSSSH